MRGPRSSVARRGQKEGPRSQIPSRIEEARARDLQQLHSRLEGRSPDGWVTCMYGTHADVAFDTGGVGFCLITPKVHKLQGLCVGDRVFTDRGAHDGERHVVGRDNRRTELRRLRGDDDRAGHVIAANADQMAIVAALDEPPLRPGALDRYLVLASVLGLHPLVVITKVDDPMHPPSPVLEPYLPLCPVILTSARAGFGVPALAEALRGHLTVFAGHSGVGKSTLCQALGLDGALAAGPLGAGGRGRHTTSVAQLLSLPGGGWVVDTPGVRAIGFVDLDRRVARTHFPELAALGELCEFPDCLHEGEEGCAADDAVDEGTIPAARLAGYRRLLASL